MADEQRYGKRSMSTASWIGLLVGLVMLSAGVIANVDARGVERQYDVIAEQTKKNGDDIQSLIRTASTNVANIANLTAAVSDLKGMMEGHILGTRAVR